MRVLRLRAENVKRIQVVDITPDRHIVRITGANGSGKTTVLDCLPFALNGLRAVCDEPLRHGTDSGFIQLDLGENGIVSFRVTRKFDKNGTPFLEVLSGEGAAYKSPQKVVGDFLGALSVDPHSFIRMPRDEQVRVLGDLVGITEGLNAIARARKDTFDTRTDVNRIVKQVRADLATAESAVQDEHAERVDVANLMQQLDVIQKRRSDHETLTRAEQVANEVFFAAEARVATLEHQLALARDNVSSREEQMKASWDAVRESELTLENDDADAIRGQMLSAERINADVAARELRDQTRGRLDALNVDADAMTASLDAYDAATTELVASATMPLPGLSLSAEGVRYEGTLLDQESKSRQIRISATMAIALNSSPGALRVLRVEDASLLDEVSFQELVDVAVEHDYQVWIEEVDRSGAVGFVMVNGVGHDAGPQANA